jgi:hypothetical protein
MNCLNFKNHYKLINEYEMIPVYKFKKNNTVKINAIIILQAFIRMNLTKHIIKLNKEINNIKILFDFIKKIKDDDKIISVKTNAIIILQAFIRMNLTKHIIKLKIKFIINLNNKLILKINCY